MISRIQNFFLEINFENANLNVIFKVENILKGSLDSIPPPSPSVKIQIMGVKVGLKCIGKTLLGVVNKLFELFDAL